jgi:uncharacterized protein (TIGR00730 family)
MKRVCVFCGSSNGAKPLYQEIARAVGQTLVDRGIGLVYGAGNIGLMSVVAETVLAGHGEVQGVIPDFMVEKELARQDLTELHVVESMHERKALMADLSDAFIALPGGYGTLEEFCEMLTWQQLHIHQKPCGLLNVDGFFDSLLQFADHQVQEGFVTPENRSLILTSDNPAGLLDLLEKGERQEA